MDFLPSISVLVTFTFVGIVLNITPGPDMTLQLNRALNEGRSSALAALAGTVSGGMVHILLAAVGISALIAASQSAFLAVKIVGAMYLLWLAFQAIKNGSSLSLEQKQRAPRTFKQNWLAGFLINIINPKVVLFFLTFLPQFVSVNDPHATQKLIFLGIYFNVVSIPVSVAYILLAHRLSTAIRTNRRIMRAIDYVFASIFGTFALKILLARVVEKTP